LLGTYERSSTSHGIIRRRGDLGVQHGAVLVPDALPTEERDDEWAAEQRERRAYKLEHLLVELELA